MLFLAGIKVNFFIVACMVLRFGFVVKTALITHQCFTLFTCFTLTYTVPRPCLLLALLHQQVGWACRRSLEGMQLGQLTRGISQSTDVLLSNTGWWKKRKWGHSERHC